MTGSELIKENEAAYLRLVLHWINNSYLFLKENANVDLTNETERQACIDRGLKAYTEGFLQFPEVMQRGLLKQFENEIQ